MRIWGTASGASAEISAFRPNSYVEALARQSCGGPAHRELEALLHEQDPELFFAALIDFGNRELNRKRPAAAALAYQLVAENAQAFPELKAKARQRWEGLQGIGAVGPRAEILVRDLAQQGADPAMLLGMTAAGLAYRAVRAGSLMSLAGSPLSQNWLSPAARSLAASAAGFAVEAPTFTLATLGAKEALGEAQDWSPSALAHSLASGALVLGGLKLGGAGAALLERQVAGRLATVSLAATPFQQGGMLAGIYLGHGLEQATGLREKLDGATTFADALATLVHFNIAGRLTPRLLNQGLTRWETAATAANRNQPGSPSPELLSPFAVPAPAGAGRGGDPKTDFIVLNSSHDDQGRGSPPPPPPPSAPRDSSHGISSKPPSEQGVITADALAWGTRQKRSSEDVNRMVKFLERIRAEMWNSLNLYVDKPLARALGQSKTLYVRVHPVEGDIDGYRLELSATPTPSKMQMEYVELSFDSNTGRLSLNDNPAQAAYFHRLKAKGVDLSRSFLGYYRSLGDFESSSLQSAKMVAHMPANVRTLVLQQATHYLRQVPKLEVLLPDLVTQHQTPIQSTHLIQFFSYVAEMARREVDAFAAEAGLQAIQSQRLQALTQKLLVGLYTRETQDPAISRFSYLIGRMRPDSEFPRQRIIEVLTPRESMSKPTQKDELLFNLVRSPSRTGDTFPYLHHVYINVNPQGEPTRAADLRFQKAIGLSSNLKIRMDSLSIETFDAAKAAQWLKENGHGNE
ncbi:MAG TPA: hypothetical protein VJR29_00595 [bacterium]|nr:hypothetical protein [bacterium]